MLRAGALSAGYAAGTLRNIRCGGTEVLRHVYAALRDERWGTPPARISKEHIEEGPDWFRIGFAAEIHADGIDYFWLGSIDGFPDSSISFQISGEARTGFFANRIGLCVLHPVEGCAGRDCWIEHTSGARERSRFPLLIAPHQPFLDVRAISHDVSPGVTASVRLEGEVFETEDHRNWTDDSFKTYCRPLRLPYPFEVRQGDRVEQRATLRVEGGGPSVRLVMRDGQRMPLPELATRRMDLHLNDPEWETAMHVAAPECAIFTSGDPAEVSRLITALEQLHPAVKRFLLFDRDGITTPTNAAQVRERLRRIYPGVPVGGGNRNFAELNRNRETVEGLDFASWGINPQVHATDEQTLIENLRAQPSTVETARSFCAAGPLAISPVSMPLETPAAGPWVLATIANLAAAGMGSVTFQEIAAADTICPLLDDFADAEAIALDSSDPLRATGLAVVLGSRMRLLLGNFLPCEQEIDTGDGQVHRLEPYGISVIDRELL